MSFLGALAGSALSVLPETIGTVGSLIQNKRALDQAGRAQELERENFAWQQRVHEYEKGIQQKIFDREDNAVSRRVEDMREAGLSPTLAAGSAARAGQAVRVGTPQRDTAPTLAKAQMTMAAARTMADITKTVAETRNIMAQRKGRSQDVEIAAELRPYRKELAHWQKEKMRQEAFIAEDSRKLQKIDLSWKKHLDDVLRAEYKKSGEYLTPERVKYMRNRLLLEIQKRDHALFQKLQQPYHRALGGFGSSAEGMAIGAMLQLMQKAGMIGEGGELVK